MRSRYIKTSQNVNGVGTTDTAKNAYDVVQKTASTSYADIQKSYASIESSTSGLSGVYTDIDGSGIQVGEEVRPTNMRVLFIMKVASVE